MKLKILLPLSACLLLAACRSGGQTLDRAASEAAFEAGLPYFQKTVSFERNDTAALVANYRKAIAQFEEAYRYDSTNRHAWMWLPGCYYELGEYDKAILWNRKDLRDGNLKKDLQGHNREEMGRAQLLLGDLEDGEQNLRTALRLYKEGDDGTSPGFLLLRVRDIAEDLFTNRKPQVAERLRRARIDPCRYSVDVLRLALALHCEKEGFVAPPEEDLLRERVMACK